MRADVRQKFEAVKAALSATPDSYMFAELYPGADGPLPDVPDGLRDLLEFADGFHVGQVGVFAAGKLARNQFYLDDAATIELIGGDRGKWLCFGVHVDFPLLMEGSTGSIWWFPEIELEYSFMATRFEPLADTMDDFVGRYLLDNGYLELTGAEDWWFEFLRDRDFLG